MKNNFLKSMFLLAAFSTALTSCVKEDDFAIPTLRPVIFSEDFNQIDFNQNFNYEGWVNFAEAGTKLWTERDFNDDGYIQFSSFGSGQASNIGWAITPAIDMDANEGEVLSFQSATNFVDNPDNKLEVFISSDFDGTNVLSATWTKLDAVVADNTTNGYTYIPSGEIDLSAYTGTIHLAFKATGNGSSLDGLFQVDKIKIYSSN
ncbi:MAG: choice-of-anchor J domain-containing protein [Flavobacterium sp.]|jgi:hypothetical protein